ELEEPVLELLLGGGLDDRIAEDVAKWTHSPAARAARHDGFERAQVEDPLPLGLGQGPDHMGLGHHLREVEEGAGKGGDGDAVDLRDLAGVEVSDAVRVEAAPAPQPAGGHGHIDVAPVVGPDAPQSGRTPMTQHGLGPVRENRSTEDTTPFEAAAPDGV